MMKKTDLVKLITKKAGISDSSAKEFFDVFLRKIAEELELGESARFGNLGYFHYRRGEIKKQDDKKDISRTGYLDLIIFSPSSQLNIKSHDNVVFNVSEMHGSVQDSLDFHFSLSVGKPVLPQLEGKELTGDLEHDPDVDNRQFENKARNLLSNLHPDQNIKSEGEILLVDIRSIDTDQFELELTEDAIKKNSQKEFEASIHSSEKLKSQASDFGSILSKQLEKNSETKGELKQTPEKKRSDNAKWDFGKRYWESVPQTKPDSQIKSQTIEPERSKEINAQVQEMNEEDLGNELFDLEDEDFPEISLKDQEPSETKTDDFSIPKEENSSGKFERVRSIRSSLQDINDEETDFKSNKYLNDKYDTDDQETDEMLEKFRSKVGDFQPTETENKENEAEEQDVVIDNNSLVELKLNRTDRKKEHLKYERKNRSSSILKILAVLIIVVGGLYLLFKENGNKEVTEVPQPIEKNDKTTYIERTYDVPVSYPYEKNESTQDVTGINLTKDEKLDPKKEVSTNSTAKETGNKETIKKEPVNVDQKKTQQPVIDKQVDGTTDNPVLISSNIYNYGSYFVVQVSAFRSEQVAQNTVTKYNLMGYKAFIETIVINGNNWYRVRVGNFRTLEEAQKFNNSKN